VFAVSSGLWRVAAGGDEPELLTTPEPRQAHRYATPSEELEYLSDSMGGINRPAASAELADLIVVRIF